MKTPKFKKGDVVSWAGIEGTITGEMVYEEDFVSGHGFWTCEVEKRSTGEKASFREEELELVDDDISDLTRRHKTFLGNDIPDTFPPDNVGGEEMRPIIGGEPWLWIGDVARYESAEHGPIFGVVLIVVNDELQLRTNYSVPTWLRIDRVLEVHRPNLDKEFSFTCVWRKEL